MDNPPLNWSTMLVKIDKLVCVQQDGLLTLLCFSLGLSSVALAVYNKNCQGKQGMEQWWERLPLTNVTRVQISASTPYLGWVFCWLSSSLREVFRHVLKFSPLSKKQHFQIPCNSTRNGKRKTFMWMCYPWIVTFLFIVSLRFSATWKSNRSLCL